jgi:hypothetical protein
MSYVSLSLITTWMALVVLGITLAGLVHLLVLAATAIVFMSGNRGARVATDPGSGAHHSLHNASA